MASGVALPSAAVAQLEPEPSEEADVEAPARVSVLARFSVGRLARWLVSETPSERLRGIERLGEVGTEAALGRLTTHAFERRAQLGGREWLALARALAPHAAQPKAQLVLAMVLNQSATQAAGPDEAALRSLARGAAALALAAEGSAPSLLVLGRALRAAGDPAAAAADALLAHPPGTLAPLLDAPGPASAELARLLGVLGDQRAFHALRGWVRGEASDVRAASAVALTRLGHLETVPLAALWLEQGPAELRQAGLEILLLAHDPRAEPAQLARSQGARLDAVEQRRLLEYPFPELAPALVAGIDRAEREGDGDGTALAGAWRWTLLGRTGGDVAVARLVRGLADERAAFAAAHALSRSTGHAAHAALQRGLEQSAVHPLALRAAAARARGLGESFRGLEARAESWLRSDEPSERAAAAWARSLAGDRGARVELESREAVRILAAASNALSFDDESLDTAARLLTAAAPGPERTALSICLLSPRVRRAVPSGLLWSLVAEGGAARPLALRALAGRVDVEVGTGVAHYLDHPDPLLREHVARGLGESGRSSAVGLLVNRLELETDEGVRRAIVMALAGHTGRTVSHWLERAARLDPSPRVRSVARLGLAGVPLADPVPGQELLWTVLRVTVVESPPGNELAGNAASENQATRSRATETDGAKAGAASVGPALLSVAPGLALPLFADPSGVLVVSGLPASHLGIRLQ